MRSHDFDIPRPQTMTQIRSRFPYETLSYRNPTHMNRQKETIQQNQQTQFYRYGNPKKTQNYVCVSIPKNISLSDTYQNLQKRSHLYSRQNIQVMNKKCRQIRTSRINPSLGLYDLQNDKRILPTRTLSAMNDYKQSILNTEMKPFIQSLKKIDKKGLKVVNNEVKNKREQFQEPDFYQQNFLEAKKGKKKKLQHNSKSVNKKSERYRPEQDKKDECGYILNKFESKLKKKCLQDNLHVMANLLKRKVKILDKKDLMLYLNKLAKRNGKQ